MDRNLAWTLDGEESSGPNRYTPVILWRFLWSWLDGLGSSLFSMCLALPTHRSSDCSFVSPSYSYHNTKVCYPSIQPFFALANSGLVPEWISSRRRTVESR